MPAVVTLPAEIDLINADEVLDQICAAFRPGVTTVVADLTTTTFCDSSGIRHLLLAHQRARVAGVQLRVAVSTVGSVRRVLRITGVERVLDIYRTVEAAITGGPSPAAAGTQELAAGT